jgi:hypothetical protein
MTTPFWSTNPAILLNKEYITEIFPTPKMSYEEKMNSITRMVILLTLLGYIFTKSINLPILGAVTIIIIYILYTVRTSGSETKDDKAKNLEGFSELLTEKKRLLNPETLESFLKTEFQQTSTTNPLGNVLLTQIHDEPLRKSAPPSFNTQVYDDINNSTKKMVQSLNKEIKNTDKQLFGDLGEKFEFDQSQRAFYSTPNTRIPNDQESFGEFLYGNMPSSKESGVDSAMERVKDSYRHTLY